MDSTYMVKYGGSERLSAELDALKDTLPSDQQRSDIKMTSGSGSAICGLEMLLPSV